MGTYIEGLSNTSYNVNTNSSGNSGIMGKDDFMNLLITQMRYQDPLNPADSSQFASQLAQFSSLEQLSNLNENVQAGLDADYLLAQSINNTLTATLIGKDVKLSGNDLTNNGDNSVKLGYNLPVQASDISIKIYNSNGTLVREIKDLEKSEGDHKLSYDFTDNNGSKLPSGQYRFEFEVKNLQDETISIENYKFGSIDGVKFSEMGTTLMVNGVQYNLADIMEILNPVTTVKGLKSNG